MEAQRLIILDRDGVINYDSDAYIKSADEFVPLPGSLEAMARLRRAGYRIAVCTNQSGLARGLFSLDDLHAMHQKLIRLLAQHGGGIDALLYCPHGPHAGCRCRKPRPGLLEEVGARLRMPLTGVPAIGDSARDLEAARAVGAQPILVRTGKGTRTLAAGVDPAVAVYDDLAAAVDALLASAA
ncbi:D-glycero-beta-D-manno-heptose 1,7-bisphosphate 7-phosphatase [Ectothiorhodospiraceae bacterium 2226]|nr:D-glycero-beta-D-manno-heptose 1,7-bisphosphate 7-phosphatase [Ectothiorhodospiraceae bacterium 2226]